MFYLKGFFMKKIVLLAGMILLSASLLRAQLVFQEDFQYTAGTPLTSNGWVAHSAGGTNSIMVVTPGLTYAGYAGSNIGNAAKLITAGGEDVNRKFTDSITSGTIYAAFLVRVDTAKTAGDYFFHLGPRTLGSTFRPRVWARTNGTDIAFGVSPGTSVSTKALKYTDFVYSPGQTYLIVLKAQFGEVPKLFINPVIGNPEPAVPTVQSDTISDPSDYGTVALRQGGSTTAPGLVIDGIRIATTWAAAVAGSGGGSGNQPPVISNLTRDPFVPMAEATIGASVTDDYNVSAVKLVYTAGSSTDSTDMTSVGGNNYEGEIPAFPGGTYVTYFIKATDDSGVVSMSSTQKYLAGITPINTLRQYDGNMVSIYRSVPARVRGVVTAGDSTFSATNIDIYIQDATSGINIFRSGGWTSYPEGSDLTVVGTVDMFNGKLEITNPNLQITNNGAGVVPAATVITPDQLKSETYEGMLVTVTGVTFNLAGGIFDSTGQLRFGGTSFYFNNDSSNVIYLDRQLWDEFHGLPIPTGAVNVRGIASQYDNSSPFTSGYQLLPRKTADINVVSVKPHDPVYPKEFALGQNYPNPFNPNTTISYDVPRAAEISIRIYNLLGQEIRTLFAGRQNPGRYTIQWDGKDNAGNTVSTGIYFYRMIGPDFTQTRKMIMMK